MDLVAWFFKFLWLSLLIILLSQTLFPSFSYSSHLCPSDQNLALLQFKKTFSSGSCSTQNPFSQLQIKPRKILSWKEGTDCCLWDRVTCDNVSGNVIGLDLGDCLLCGTIDPSSTVFLLSHLQRLNLSHNSLATSQIPSTISQQLHNLTRLDISSSYFSGPVPEEISHLSELVSLDLSYNNGLQFKALAMERLVQNMTKLSVLSLAGVDMSDVAPYSLVNFPSSLTSLNLELCQQGAKHREEFPVDIFKLPNMQLLQLWENPVIVQFPKSNWTSLLKFLEVARTSFMGELPDSIGDLKSLDYRIQLAIWCP